MHYPHINLEKKNTFEGNLQFLFKHMPVQEKYTENIKI